MALQRHLRVLSARIEETGMAAVNVAFATSDRQHVNEHFGSASGFVIYSVAPEQVRLVSVAEFDDTTQDGHNESKLAAKLHVLQGCAAVYCLAVGGSAIRQLLNLGVQPIRIETATSIEQILRELRAELGTLPPVWLTRALERQRATDSGGDRFDAMAAEGWKE
jgi:nitrogen fixation protein NifX